MLRTCATENLGWNITHQNSEFVSPRAYIRTAEANREVLISVGYPALSYSDSGVVLGGREEELSFTCDIACDPFNDLMG